MICRFLLLCCCLTPLVVDADALAPVPIRPFTVAERLAHDPSLFTQGMVIQHGQLYESGGNYGRSRLSVRGLTRPEPTMGRRLPARWFAEGITIHNNQLWMITWREGIAVSVLLPSLEPAAQFRYRGEGWGLTSDGQSLIMSDGSARLAWRNPADFSVTRTLDVLADGQPVTQLNELEWVNGWILANVWQTPWIVGISPDSGQVAFKLSTAGLLSDKEAKTADVPNGIAYDADRDALYLSGKLWPWMFRIDHASALIPPAS